METAADSVASDGIGCTSQLEHALHSGLMQMGLELMTALLTSDLALEDNYEKSAGERNGGRHAKTVTTVFGDVRIPARTYYHKTSSGHFPWDDRMGLCGSYTPAVIADALRLASIHNYEEAAQEFARSHAFPISPDAIRDIVTANATKARLFLDLDASTADTRRADRAYILGDGTGISIFGKYLEGVKGKDGGRAKTREVKLGAIFTGSVKKGEPHRDEDSTTYVATTMRWREFGAGLRKEFDRRFPMKPAQTIFLTDGGKWLRSVRDNFDRMNYGEYSDKFWFVGSGVVESGCKCVVQQRMDNSGMHWSIDGAEALLMIRAMYKSGRLDEYTNWLVKDLDQVVFRPVA